MVSAKPEEELMAYAKNIGAPFDLVRDVHQSGTLPVVNFAAGGIATPADAALMMQLGVDGVFVGSGIFKSASDLSQEDQQKAWFERAQAIVRAVSHFEDPDILAEVSLGLGEAMVGINSDLLEEEQLLATRGW